MQDIPAEQADDDLHYIYDNRVRYAETDAQGVVFYGEYVTYQDETTSELLRRLDHPYESFADLGVDLHVVHTDVDYRATAAFDDRLTNGIRVERFGESSVTFAWACRRRDDGEVVATGHVTHVAVDDETREPTRVPESFRSAVRSFQDVPPVTE